MIEKKIYFDACCLNRPFDDQSQVRVHLESEAILMLIDLIKKGKLIWLNSDIVEFEIGKIQNLEKKNKILGLFLYSKEIIELSNEIELRAQNFEKLGFSNIDALHIASE
jgi:hypothetical protein